MMPDVFELMSALSKLDTGDIATHAERCVAVRNRNAHCRRCSQACTSGAISLIDNDLIIDVEKCVGCGACATICPTAALEARNPTDSELLRSSSQIMREKKVPPVFACKSLLESNSEAYDRSKVVEVGCLGRLEESELVTLIALGLLPLVLAHGACEACSQLPGRRVADLVYETMTSLLGAWGHDNPLRLVEGLPAEVALERREAVKTEDAAGMSRRDFFTQIKTGAQSVATQSAAQVLRLDSQADEEKPPVVRVMRDGTLPHFIPNRRERMLDYLERIGEPSAEWLDSRLWGYLSINADLCNSCRMCATFCPTGAIVKFDDPGEDGVMGIEHYPADCVQCRLCEDVCPSDALTISSRVPVRKLVEGEIVRHVMKPPEHELNSPKQIYNAMYQLLGGGQIYER
ncbi:MAG: 4Fe-4S binding protein [Coriobacteriales bacterium]|jgi:formate hydrogenlyase subunit 6/NADH:ubiquinone oxidoreductase subunit I|nr:4Fe-4S binding protein [Coriobacteriales bacterium]